MGDYDEEARARLRKWVVARNVTRTALGEAAGHNQSWATRYLDHEFLAGLDELGGMATLFGQPLTALFDPHPDPDEHELIIRFRGLPPTRQKLLLQIVRDWAPDEPHVRGKSQK